MILEID